MAVVQLGFRLAELEQPAEIAGTIDPDQARHLSLDQRHRAGVDAIDLVPEKGRWQALTITPPGADRAGIPQLEAPPLRRGVAEAAGGQAPRHDEELVRPQEGARCEGQRPPDSAITEADPELVRL